MKIKSNFKLPKNWSTVKLGIVIKSFIGGGTPSKAVKGYFQGKIPFMTVKDMNISRPNDTIDHITNEALENSSSKLIPADTIVIATRMGLGKIVRPTVDVAINQDLKALIPIDILDKDYLEYWFKSISNSLDSMGTGTTVKGLRLELLKELPFPLSPPNEQKRIVDKIEKLFSDLDDAEANLKKVQNLIKTYRQSVLKAAVTGELSKEWREKNKGKFESGKDLLKRILKTQKEQWKGKFKESTLVNTKSLPSIPESWSWATLQQLGAFGRGKSKHRPRNDPKLYENGKYPFLQTGIVRNSKGIINTYNTLYNDFGLSQSKLWPKGTVCITIAANIAESGILQFEACFPDSIVGLIPSNYISGEYIEFFLRTIKDELDRFAPATAQKNINLEILSKVGVPLPPFEEQLQIYENTQMLLSKINKVEETLISSFKQIEILKQSILKSAFSGQLVPQDSNDEPASALLMRIQSGNLLIKEKSRHSSNKKKIPVKTNNSRKPLPVIKKVKQ